MRTRRELTRLGYRRIVQLLVSLVILPGGFLSAIGVLLLVLGEAGFSLLMGILVLLFCGMLVTGVILVWVFLRRERDLSELQADFVSKVSHELRTPLTSIRMFTETLALRRGDERTEQLCIDTLQRESARLQELIDRLLDWGRMESGRRVYELDVAEPGSIAHEAVASFEPTRTRRHVELEIDVPEGLPEIWCDRAALVDALVNLMSNAYKYGGDPRRIRVAVRELPGRVEFSVRDNGPGIPQREHKRIWDKFYRVDDLLSRQQEGSGLGLSIVQHVVRAHGGQARVDSEPGSGSTFSIAIPTGAPSIEAVGGRRGAEVRLRPEGAPARPGGRRAPV